jgi:hypothetical protein
MLLRFASALLLSTLFAALPTAQSVQSVPRIQLGRYVDPVNKIDDPLNEIVEIRYFKGGDNYSGTGTFLKDCRVITALHVLLNMVHGTRTDYLKNVDESLVGEKFDFVTNPIPSADGRVKSVVGSFVVLGHGKPLRGSSQSIADEEWVIGYDAECVSDKYKLGFVIPIDGQRLDGMVTRDYYFTAGHSVLPAARRANGDYALYIDSRCHVTDREHLSDDYVLTGCSASGGGSGQLLMTYGRKRGEIQFGAGGQPVKLGHAIFTAIEDRIDLQTPNIKGATGFAPFTLGLYGKLLPFLEGPVDTEKLAQIALNRRRGARVP